MKKLNILTYVVLACLLVVSAIGFDGKVNAKPKNDPENNGVPAFGVMKKNYVAWWEEKAKHDEYAKEQWETFNQLNEGQKNKFLKAILDGKTTREALDKWADKSLPQNEVVPVGDSGVYVKATSKWLDKKGKAIKNVRAASELPDGSYYYRYERDLGYIIGDHELNTSKVHVTVFATVKDGEIQADNATGGHSNINPFLEIRDGVSSSFTQGDRAVGNQPFEVVASAFGFIDMDFLSRSLNLYSYIDKSSGTAGGWAEFEEIF